MKRLIVVLVAVFTIALISSPVYAGHTVPSGSPCFCDPGPGGEPCVADSPDPVPSCGGGDGGGCCSFATPANDGADLSWLAILPALLLLGWRMRR